MIYPKRLLFGLPPESAQGLSLWLIKRLHSLYKSKLAMAPVHFTGLKFDSPVGLAAGLDKDAYCIDAWLAMGFGSVEVGTVTLRPQSGHPRPRLFRLQRDSALINRFGFNSLGADVVADRLAKRRRKGIVGVNIGKNADVPARHATQNYLRCFQKVAPVADYVTINISSPNTEGLRKLHYVNPLSELLDTLCEERAKLNQKRETPLPLWLKISPDLTLKQFFDFTQVVSEYPIDALVVANTTVSRNNLDSMHQSQHGGLSGQPLKSMSDELLKRCRQQLPDMPLVGVGGIMQAEDAVDKFQLGAQLVQVYTGLVYRGPRLLSEIHKAYAGLFV